MKVTCEKCGATLTAPDDASGKTVRCPKCKHTFKVDILELTEDVGAAPSQTSASALDELAGAAQQPSPAGPPIQPHSPVQSSAPVMTIPQRRCAQCGFQGYMPKKWDSWVVPVAIIVAIFTCGVGLLILLVPKKHQCPQCGSSFE